MSNPFGEPDDESSGAILEGFLCPICREDLKSAEFLTVHFERSHAEEQDALKSIFKDILSKAKSKILNIDESFDLPRSIERNVFISSAGTGFSNSSSNLSYGAESVDTRLSNARTRTNVYNFMDHQEVGKERNHLEYFHSVRNPRLERYASETNKLIIRLNKLLSNMPSDPVLRKQHERNIVTWLDGTSVKLCPNCAKSFHIARRQHHCRLCGSIMCNDCSKFLSIEIAIEMASVTMTHGETPKEMNKPVSGSTNINPQLTGIRSCDHCLWLLETRQEMHQARTCCPPVSKIYADIQRYSKDVLPDVEMYAKIVNSLYEGESIYTISDASILRGKIGQVAETIDICSKRILAIPCQQGSREEALKKAIRLSCIQLIKEKMLSLPPLPAENDIREIQERKRMEAEQRIETERRQAMELYQRYGLAGGGVDTQGYDARSRSYVQGSDLRSLDNWSAQQVSISQNEDPLIEQINIIKGYIKQARQENNLDVVETLESNLRELQREFYERQRTLRQSNVQNEN